MPRGSADEGLAGHVRQREGQMVGRHRLHHPGGGGDGKAATAGVGVGGGGGGRCCFNVRIDKVAARRRRWPSRRRSRERNLWGGGMSIGGELLLGCGEAAPGWRGGGGGRASRGER